MTHSLRYTQSGFSAVELLITLFIATAFIATGYQLYSVIIKDGGTARTRTVATNIAYDNLRRYASQATNPCTLVTPSPTPTIPADSGLPNASITVTFSCPYGQTDPATKVQVTVTYGTPQEEVTHALYVNN
jgi:Tfp pilus assembly protein PilV